MTKDNNNHYNKKLKTFARNHRNDSTQAEIRIWCELLRNKQMGFSFLRQRAIGPYIVDFYCKDLNLIVEVDGLTHQWEENVRRDFIKENALKNLGYHVIRFTDEEVMKYILNVQRTILFFIENNPPCRTLANAYVVKKGTSTNPASS